MKRIAMLLVLMLVLPISTTSMVLAEEKASPEQNGQQNPKKDECLLVARNCGTSVMSIQDKIERLKEEIAKGRAVYTIEELNNLQQKLDEVSRTLDYLLEK